MEGLGASIYNNGIMQGRMEGRMEGRKVGLMEGRKEGWMEGTIFTLSELISKKILGIPDAAKMAGMSDVDFLSALASFGKDGLPK